MATISKYQTASGATPYRVRYRTPDNRQTDKRGFTTKRDAERFAASVEVSKMRGEYVAPSSARATVGELGPAWLDRQRGHLKPSGYAVMETTWRVRVKPRWGNVALGDIRRTAVQQWISDLGRGTAGVRPLGLAPSSVRITSCRGFWLTQYVTISSRATRRQAGHHLGERGSVGQSRSTSAPPRPTSSAPCHFPSSCCPIWPASARERAETHCCGPVMTAAT
jgi:hypothetical protein